MFLSWWRRLVQTANPRSANSKGANSKRMPRKLRYVARLEQLEDRVVPAGTTKVFLDVGANINNIAAARSATVPVFIDVDTLNGGAGGIQSGTFYVKYDPTVLSINQSSVPGPDIKLGSLLSSFPAGTYNVGTAAGFGSGVVGVGITHATSTFYTGTAGGHLVELDFHVLQTIPVDQTALLDIVPSLTGHLTVVADMAGSKYSITPALTTYSGGALSQTGALTPSTFTPPDADGGDAAVQVVAKQPSVAPVAADDTFSTAPNNGSFPTTMTVSGQTNGVLANDTDANGPMNAVLIGGNAITVGRATVNGTNTVTYTQSTAHGSVTLNAVDGSFTYTPSANFTGTDSFTYQAVDAISNTPSSTVTATIQVGGLVSIPQNLTIGTAAGSTVKVPINIANPNPVGSGGLSAATIGINYDKTKFTVTSVDIGSVLSAAGWTTFVPNFSTPGRIDITAGGTPITSTKGGDIADITFQVVPGAGNGPSVVNLGASTQLIVNGTGTPLVLPFAEAPVDNTSNTPGPLDGVILVGSATAPTISVSPNTLDLGSTVLGTAGTAKTYTVSGSNLAAGIVITAPAGVEVSSDGGTSYHSTVTLTPASGTVASTTINTRITSSAPQGAISGKITDTSTGATEQDVTVSGTVNSAAAPTISVTPSSLDLGTTVVGTAGSAQTYSVSGSNLTAGIVITAPAGVEVSSDGGTSYHSTVTLTPASGTVASTTINTRITSSAPQGAISGKITDTSTGATEQDVTVTGTVNNVATPTITVSPSSLDLGSTVLGTAGSAKTYTVSGSNLTAGIVITAPAGVEVSSDGGTSYHSTVTLTPASGTVASTTINTRITSSAAQGAISGKITDTSTGATEQDVTVTGTVTAAAAPTVTVSPSSLDLGQTNPGTAGTAKTYTVSGSNLTAGIVITAPTGVEVSSDGGTSYHSTVTLTPASGTVANTTINVRISATAVAGVISGKVTNTSTGATEEDVSVSGTVGQVVARNPGTLFLEVGGSANNTSVVAGRSQTVKVFIDAGDLSTGAHGVQSGTFYVKYDATVLSINESAPGTPGSDVQLGDLLTPFGSAYSVGTAAGFGSGLVGVGVTHATSTFYTGTAGGHLVELDFHVLQTIPVGESSLLDFVPSTSGHLTVLADVNGSKYALTPPLTTYAGSLTQSGALTPATLSPADADVADTTVQVVAQTPAVAPTAVNDTISVAPNNGSFPATAKVSGANGVLANDTDANGPMNAVLVGGSTITVGTGTVGGVPTTTYTQNTAHGSLTLNAVDGSFSYTPAAGFTGTDSFTYQAVDALTNTPSNTATATIEVGGLVSIPQNLTLDASNTANTVTVPVNITSPDPVNSGGLVTAIIKINYDKGQFTATAVTIGSVLKNAGWTSFVSNFGTPGRIDISASGPAILSSKGGDLADITFSPVSGANNGAHVINLGTGTELDVAGTGTPQVLPFAITPVDNPTATPGPVDGVITITGGAQTISTTTTVSTSNATPVYGTPVTLTATVAPASGTTVPTLGSVSFYVNGNTLLGAGTSAGSDANHDALFTYVTGPGQLQVAGAPQAILAAYTGGSGFSSSTSTNNVTETVSPATLTVTGITAANKVYDTTTKATLNTGSAALSGLVAGDNVTLSTANAAGVFTSKDVGNAIPVTVSGLTISGSQAGNYTLTQPTVAANITPAPLTVTGVTAKDKVYDATTKATLNTAGATLVGVLPGDTVTLNPTGATGTFASKDVGNGITVTASGLGLSGPQGSDYVLTQPTTTGNITPATLTVTGLTAKDKVYDTTTAATLNTAGASLSGVFAGDTVTLDTASAKGTFASKDAGTGITVNVTGLSIGGPQVGDYTLAAPTPTANITPAPLTVSITAKDKAYDGTTKATLNTSSASLSGVLGTDLVSLNASGAQGTFATKDVGNGITVTVTGLALSGAQAPDYFITPTTTTGNITPAALTVTGIKANDKVYDATTKATLDTSGAALSGVVSGDTVTLNTSAATGAFLTKAVGSGKTVVVSGLTLSGPQASDYTVTAPTPTANITQASVTVSGITAKDKTYDGTTAATLDATGASLSGVFAGDTVTVTGGTGTFTSKDVGNAIPVTVTAVTLGGAQGGNYKVSPLPTTGLTANITPKALTVTGITASNKVYDGTTAATLNTSSAGLSGVVTGDTVTLNKDGVTGTFASKDAGNGITVTVTGLSLGGAQANDYTLTQPTTTANITPAPLTVTGIIANDKVYNGTTAATLETTNFAFSGVLPGDTVTLDASNAKGVFASKDVGTGIAVTVTGLALSGPQANDYTVTQPGLTANITPAPLTVTGISAKDKVYDTTTAATLDTSKAALAGVVSGDTVTLNASGATGTFASKDAGTGITVTVSGLALSGPQAGDYTLTQPTTTANITPAPLTVTGILPKDKVYDSTTAISLDTSSAVLSGVLDSDNVTVAGATGTLASKDVGTGITVTITAVTLGGAQAADYQVTPPTTLLTANITPAPLTVTGITVADKVYNGTTSATLDTTNAALAGVFLGDSVTLSTLGATGAFASKDVGNGITVAVSGLSISGPQAGDYTLTQPTPTGNITPAPLTVTGITAKNKTFDTTTTATLNTASAALVGVLAGDTVTLNTSGATGTFASIGPGNNIPVQVSGLTLGGAQAGDYTVIQPTTSASITPAPAPVVQGVGPNAGAPGAVVQVFGTGFLPNIQVLFGGVAGTVTNVTPTAVTVTAPTLTPGTVSVKVVNLDNQSSTLGGAFYALPSTTTPPVTPALTVTAVSPASGPATGGTVVRVFGNGFQAGSQVFIGGVLATAVGTQTTTTLSVITPALPAGPADVMVTTPGGQQATLHNAFVALSAPPPTISAVIPTVGNAGAVVTVYGSNFGPGTQVFFGGVLATITGTSTPNILKVVVPALPATGPVDVKVVNADGQSADLPGAFFFLG
jgi:hypothetical protein